MRDSMRRFSVAAVAIIVATLSATCFGQAQLTGVSRIVGFGDVHGAYDELVALLEANGIVDQSLSWSAGDTHLVSLGDLLDRGPGARRHQGADAFDGLGIGPVTRL